MSRRQGRSRRESGEGWSLTPASSEAAGAEPVTALDPDEHRLEIRVESRARGKKVTRVGPFSLSDSAATDLAKALKKACGAGGKWDGQFLEIQGDLIDRARETLNRLGFQFR